MSSSPPRPHAVLFVLEPASGGDGRDAGAAPSDASPETGGAFRGREADSLETRDKLPGSVLVDGQADLPGDEALRACVVMAQDAAGAMVAAGRALTEAGIGESVLIGAMSLTQVETLALAMRAKDTTGRPDGENTQWEHGPGCRWAR